MHPSGKTIKITLLPVIRAAILKSVTPKFKFGFIVC